LPSSAEVYFDGAARGNPGPAGAGIILKVDGRVEKIKRYLGRRTNNQAEYLALIKALEVLASIGCRSVTAYTDSQLVVNQLTGRYRVRDAELKRLHSRVSELVKKFEKFDIVHVSREANREADRLANQAIDEASE
jgi:ribonuclease HI